MTTDAQRHESLVHTILAPAMVALLAAAIGCAAPIGGPDESKSLGNFDDDLGDSSGLGEPRVEISLNINGDVQITTPAGTLTTATFDNGDGIASVGDRISYQIGTREFSMNIVEGPQEILYGDDGSEVEPPELVLDGSELTELDLAALNEVGTSVAAAMDAGTLVGPQTAGYGSEETFGACATNLAGKVFGFAGLFGGTTAGSSYVMSSPLVKTAGRTLGITLRYAIVSAGVAGLIAATLVAGAILYAECG